MNDEDYSLRFDAKHGVLLVTAGKHLTEDVYWAIYGALANFVATNGPCPAILGLSAVEKFDLSNQLAREIADTPAAIPSPMKRIVVASEPVMYGTVRIFETLRENTAAPVTLDKTIDETYTKSS